MMLPRPPLARSKGRGNQSAFEYIVTRRQESDVVFPPTHSYMGYLGSGRACRCAGGHSPVVDWCSSPAGRLSAQLWADASQVRNVIRVRSLPNVRALALAAEGNKEAVSAAVVQGFISTW